MKLLIIFFLILPSLTFGQLEGTFSKNYGMSSETFCLNKDGTYNFIGGTDLIDILDNGSYKINGDTITLNSEVQPDDLFKVKKWKIDNLDSVYISFNLLSGEEQLLTTLIINDSIRYLLVKNNEIKNGIVKFEKGYVKTMRIESTFLPGQLRERTIFLENNNIIEILVDDTKGYARAFFTNEKFTIKKTFIQSLTEEDRIYTIQPNKKCKE